MQFVAIKKWKDGGETVVEYFETFSECLKWIKKQPKPKGDEFVWSLGSYK